MVMQHTNATLLHTSMNYLVVILTVAKVSFFITALVTGAVSIASICAGVQVCCIVIDIAYCTFSLSVANCTTNASLSPNSILYYIINLYAFFF